LGFRDFDSAGAWDGLYDFGFVISATFSPSDTVGLPLDAQARLGQPYIFVNTRDANKCDRIYPENWLPQTQSVYTGAVPVSSAGGAQINSVFWWEAMQYDGAFKVRVFWDCSQSPYCIRRITLTNFLNYTLDHINIVVSFDFDVIPVRGHEDLFIFSPTDSGSWVPAPAITRSMLTWDGQVRPLTNSDIPDSSIPCWQSANEDIDFSFDDVSSLCDAGCVYQYSLPAVPPGGWVSTATQFGIDDEDTYTDNSESSRKRQLFNSQFICESGSGLSGTPLILASVAERIESSSFSKPNDRFHTEPGTCPCVTGTCTLGIILPCICDETHHGLWCEHSCHNGVAVSGSCSCNEGWWGDHCDFKCDCLRNSHCDPVNGDCLCKNGLSGDQCDVLFQCPKGQQ